MTTNPDSIKSIFYALFANLAIAVAKAAAAFWTGSGAMMAEAIHSVADSCNQLLLLFGIRQSKRPPHNPRAKTWPPKLRPRRSTNFAMIRWSSTGSCQSKARSAMASGIGTKAVRPPKGA